MDYYGSMADCECGCGSSVEGLTRGRPRRFVSGHNLRGLDKTDAHRTAIAEGQRRAWRTKRQRLAVGSQRSTSDGYIVVKVHEGKGPWRAEHLLVMEAEIGRPLRPEEVVHHINGNRADNTVENLYLCRDRSHHNRVHASQDEALRVLLAAGNVVFSAGRYEAVLRGHS